MTPLLLSAPASFHADGGHEEMRHSFSTQMQGPSQNPSGAKLYEEPIIHLIRPGRAYEGQRPDVVFTHGSICSLQEERREKEKREGRKKKRDGGL